MVFPLSCFKPAIYYSSAAGAAAPAGAATSGIIRTGFLASCKARDGGRAVKEGSQGQGT